MPEQTPGLAERVVAAMLRGDGATRSLGMIVKHVEAGACVVQMEVRDNMLNGNGTCHGGVLFTLADSAFGFACNSRNLRTVAASGQIDYLRPALVGDILQATAVERSAGRRLGLYDVTLTNQHGQTIALFRGKSCRIHGTMIEEDEGHDAQA